VTDAQAHPTTRDGRPIELADDRDGLQYTARVGGQLVGFAQYQLTDQLVVFTRTETDSSVEGQGVASVLVRFALDDVRAQRTRRVLAVCPFVTAYLQRHPEDADLNYLAGPGSAHD